jgi:hypothetical protein
MSGRTLDGGLAKAEEFVASAAEEMTDLGKWGHRYAHIKQQGRCELYVPPPAEGEEEAGAYTRPLLSST